MHISLQFAAGSCSFSGRPFVAVLTKTHPVSFELLANWSTETCNHFITVAVSPLLATKTSQTIQNARSESIQTVQIALSVNTGQRSVAWWTLNVQSRSLPTNSGVQIISIGQQTDEIVRDEKGNC